MKISELTSLLESKSAPLYHATTTRYADMILQSNKLKGITSQVKDGKMIFGVSLTRSIHFAKTLDLVSENSRVIFVLDQEKLSQKFKILPIDFYTTHPEAHGFISDKYPRRRGDYAESEEFILGDITNVNNYITRIILSKETYLFNEENLRKIRDGEANDLAARNIAKNYLAVKNNSKTIIEK